MELCTGFFLPSLPKIVRALMEKQKLKRLEGGFAMFWFFGILKIRGFVFVVINLLLKLQSSRNVIMPTDFANLILTRCYNSAFLLFNLIQMK